MPMWVSELLGTLRLIRRVSERSAFRHPKTRYSHLFTKMNVVYSTKNNLRFFNVYLFIKIE